MKIFVYHNGDETKKQRVDEKAKKYLWEEEGRAVLPGCRARNVPQPHKYLNLSPFCIAPIIIFCNLHDNAYLLINNIAKS